MYHINWTYTPYTHTHTHLVECKERKMLLFKEKKQKIYYINADDTDASHL